MSPSEKAFHVSWDQFHRDAKALSWRLMDKDWKAMIAITRGGLVPAAIIARELDVRLIETFCVASYKDKAQGGMNIIKSFGSAIEDIITQGDEDKILIIDDLVDTGNTGKLMQELLPKAHLATVYAKPEGRKIVDSYMTEVSQDTWIHFPWDLSLQFSQPAVSSRV